ncbi:LysR family transcriptional regulator [Ferrimonas balearica]|uniref:LysR family transcriptional regulator n=1 Tax=Ferrimonas balearica TaxID=44012 RepID=UPI001C971881|nr:LysR family transcriptional regulator [Ferrimonas balearica]MBY6108612.1 LysR family transcriptional regulator [Ferrimonas balearica]
MFIVHMHKTDNVRGLDLNLLKTLQVLLEERHVGRAAIRLHLSQSAVSHALARLRKALGDPLFVRTAHGLEPTSRALAMEVGLAQVIADIDQLLQPKQFEPSAMTGTFRLLTHHFLLSRFLGLHLDRLKKSAPNLELSVGTVREGGYDQLERQQADLIIASGLHAKPRLYQQRLREERLVCLLSPHHPAIGHWDAETFVRLPFVRLELIGDRDDPVWLYAQSRHQDPPSVDLVVENLVMIPPLLVNSERVALVPAAFADEAQAHWGLRIMPCPIPAPALTIRALWHERHHQTPAHQWIRTELMKGLLSPP